MMTDDTSLLENLPNMTPPLATTKPNDNAGATPTAAVDQPQAISQLQANNDEQPVQYYRARFENQVRIQSGHTTIEADRLNVVFSLETHSDQNQIFQELGLGWPPPTPSDTAHGYTPTSHSHSRFHPAATALRYCHRWAINPRSMPCSYDWLAWR